MLNLVERCNKTFGNVIEIIGYIQECEETHEQLNSFLKNHHLYTLCTHTLHSPRGVVYAVVTELLTFSCVTVCVVSTTTLYRVFGCSAEIL